MPSKFAFERLDDAIDALANRLRVVELDDVVNDCNGRVLAEPVVADRNSPAADVSAMDGYAFRMGDLVAGNRLPVGGESLAGSPPPVLNPGSPVRIFTGALVPENAELVIKREDVIEEPDSIRLPDPLPNWKPGENIRRSGENALEGTAVIDAGTLIHSANRATMINFGCFHPKIFRPVRVSVITTGDEVGMFENEIPKPWQLRNSNRVAIVSCLAPHRWIDIHNVEHCRDDKDSLERSLRSCIDTSDAVLLTGGVSMGDYDYVPEVVQACGGEILFHGLPQRPGKPTLGAATSSGKLILGLPGNPVSATIGCRRMALPLLAKISGQRNYHPRVATVTLEAFGDKTLPLFWQRLVRLVDHGRARIVSSQGSGDLVSLGQSDGFIECPPGAHGNGPWPYYSWT